MVIDHSGLICGVSASRMSKYLSLCMIDMVVSKVEANSIPFCHLDQPSKVGMAEANTESYPDPILGDLLITSIYDEPVIDDNIPFLKEKLCEYYQLEIQLISKAGYVTIPSRYKELEIVYPIYSILSLGNFANQHKSWNVCFVDNQQKHWVDSNAYLLLGNRLNPKGVFYLREGQIRYVEVPKVVRRS